MDIRQALKNNLSGMDANELENTINSGIASREETILPGLGVLFEMYYQSLDGNAKKKWVQDLTLLLD